MAWRRDVHHAIVDEAAERGIQYLPEDSLEVEVQVYLSSGQMKFHDVDNLLKHLLDALQGRLGGPKSRRTPKAILPNDHQIRRVAVEKKRARTKKDRSRLIVRGFTEA